MPKSDPSPKDDLAAKVAKAVAQDARTTELEKTVAALTLQLAKVTEMAGRAQADLQNAKMRMEKNAEELRKYAAEEFLQKILPTIDSFQRAFQHLPEELKRHEWVKGMTVLEQHFMKQIKEMGLQQFVSLGLPIDPSRHEVLLTGPGKTGTVVEVFEEGYELYGRVLRPAKVCAGDGSSGTQTEQVQA